MGLEITSRNESSIMVLELSGNIDSSTAQVLRDKFAQLQKDGHFVRIVLNAKKLDFVSSVGWGIIMNAAAYFEEKGGKILIAEAGPKIHRLCDIMGVSARIELFDSEKEAVDRFVREYTDNAADKEG